MFLFIMYNCIWNWSLEDFMEWQLHFLLVLCGAVSRHGAVMPAAVRLLHAYLYEVNCIGWLVPLQIMCFTFTLNG